MINALSFEPLIESHFRLLLKWLQTPHVKLWWDQEIQWNADSIKDKYSSYVKGYKLINGVSKHIRSYIISFDSQHIGYIQLYNLRDFNQMAELDDLPSDLLAIDFYIGEPDYLKRGIGTKALTMFLDKFIDKQYKHVFVAADENNIAAIKTYLACAFKQVKTIQNEIWMLKDLKPKNLTNEFISNLLNDLSDKINNVYGYVEVAGDNFGEPAINSGPCGPFANAFFHCWNKSFDQKVNIVFVMVKNSDECWHVLIRLPNGLLFDGGVGVHNDSAYSDKFYIEDMKEYDMEILEQRSNGLTRKYPRYCPNFSIDYVENLIQKCLRKVN